MAALQEIPAYFDGNAVRTLERLPAKKNQRLIVTVLDDFLPERQAAPAPQDIDRQAIDKAIDEAFGMWKDHDNSMPVDDLVRSWRRRRYSDI